MCVFRRWTEREHALYQLFIESLSVQPTAAGTVLIDLDVRRVEWKLRINRVPVQRWADIDEQLTAILAEYRQYANASNVHFDEHDIFAIEPPEDAPVRPADEEVDGATR